MIAKAIYKLLTISALLLPAAAGAADLSDKSVYREALSLYRHGMYERAMTLFSSISGSDPLYEDYALMCAVKMGLPEAEQMVSDMDSVHRRTIINSDIHYQQALKFFDDGRYEDCIEEFSKTDSASVKGAAIAAMEFRLGISRYNLADYENAVPHLQKVADSKNGDYLNSSRFALGICNYRLSRFAEAEDWFKLAREEEQYASLSDFFIVECRYMQQDYAYVVKEGKAMADSASDDRVKHISRLVSEASLVLGDAGQARKYLEMEELDAVVRTDDDNFHAGSVLYSVGEYNAAIKYYGDIRNRNTKNGQIAMYQLGRSYIETGNKADALTAFKTASESAFDADIAEDSMFNYAKLAFDLNGDISVFNDYLRKYSTSRKGDVVYGYLAMSYLKLGDYAAAVEAYDNIEVLDADQKSNYVKANYLRAGQLLSNGSYRDAVKYLRGTSYYLPKTSSFGQLSRYYLGEAYYKSGQYAEALKTFTELYNLSALDSKAQGRRIPYNVAYCHFRQLDYDNAAKWFDRYLRTASGQDREDALLRRADCDYARRDYKSAATGYTNYLTEFAGPSKVYPRYQLGMSYELLGDKKARVEALRPIMNADPESDYYFDALYALGNACVAVNDTSGALAAFRQLKEKTAYRDYAAKAVLGEGMVMKNAGRNQEAIALYKEVIDMMPGSEYSENALMSLKAIWCDALGDPEKYLAFVEEKGLLSESGEDNRAQLYYNTAEQIFLGGNYAGAISSFTRFLSMFPESGRNAEAYYYLGASYRKTGAKEKACDCFRQSVSYSSTGTYAEMSVLGFANVSYELQRYDEAYTAYASLRNVTTIKDNSDNALLGMMRSAYRAKMFGEAADAAAKVQLSGVYTEDERREALYVQAKSCLSLSNRDKAFELLGKLSAQASTPEGAEAYFIIIQSRYDWGKYESVETGVFDFAGKCGDQSYWLARAYIVLGDAYAARGNDAQAKETYNSIKAGYEPYGEGDDILSTIESRLCEMNI